MFCVALLLSLLFDASNAAPDFSAADTRIEHAIAEGKAPGAVLLVGTRERVLYRKAFGSRSLAPTTLPMEIDTIFDLASLTKSIATTPSVLALVDRGKIDLHAPVAKYLPEFAANSKDKITVEMLLLHRGGLVADDPMADYENGAAEAMKNILATKPTHEPGTHFTYSDVGFLVLGELVHRVDGRPLNEFASAEVFSKLDTTTLTFLPDAQLRTRIAPTEKRDGRYTPGDVHDPRAYALGGVAGHAGLFGTADDVAKYCQMLLSAGVFNGKRILSPEIVRQMQTLQTLPDGTGGRGYGLDFTSSFSSCRGERFERGATFGHTGYTGTMFWVDPVHDCFFVLLTNRVHPDGKGDVSALRKDVATIVGKALLD